MSNQADAAGPIQVGIGLVRREDQFLIRQRPAGTAMAGYWEFPGGKCEPGESPDDATRRECWEETGLRVVIRGCRQVITHRYPHAWVELHYFDCEPEPGEAVPAPDSGFLWVPGTDLRTRTFPEANDPILEALEQEFGDMVD